MWLDSVFSVTSQTTCGTMPPKKRSRVVSGGASGTVGDAAAPVPPVVDQHSLDLIDAIASMPRGLMKMHMLPFLKVNWPLPLDVVQLLRALMRTTLTSKSVRMDIFGQWLLHTPDHAVFRMESSTSLEVLMLDVDLSACSSAVAATRLRALPGVLHLYPNDIRVYVKFDVFDDFMQRVLKSAIAPERLFSLQYLSKNDANTKFAVTRNDPDVLVCEHVFDILDATCIDQPSRCTALNATV